MTEQIKVTAAGEIQLNEIVLIVLTTNGSQEVDITRVFAEINLFEDMFSNTMYGNILFGDSNNLLDQLAIQGFEGIRINVKTPGFSDKQRIYKTFGIYSVTDQTVINNDRYQSYRLHFASLELLSDSVSKTLNRPLPAKQDGISNHQEDLIKLLYTKYLVKRGSSDEVPRNIGIQNGMVKKLQLSSDLIMGAAGYDYTELKKVDGIYYDNDHSANGSVKIQLIIPNWSALKAINWVTHRSVPIIPERAGSFLFFESNKAFHFADINTIIELGKKDSNAFKYVYNPGNLLAKGADPSKPYTLDIAGEYQRVIKFEYGNNFNVLDATNMSYFGNQIRVVDPILKRYRQLDYSFTADYDKMLHTTTKPAIPIIPKAPNYMLGPEKTTIDTRRNIQIRHRESFFLFDNDFHTPTVSVGAWESQRAARLASMSRLSLNLYVFGRTDMKVGTVIDFTFPSLRGDLSDPSTFKDTYYTGYFLVTAISHFISPITHKMTLEVVKDGLEAIPDNTDSVDPEELAYDAPDAI